MSGTNSDFIHPLLEQIDTLNKTFLLCKEFLSYFFNCLIMRAVWYFDKRYAIWHFDAYSFLDSFLLGAVKTKLLPLSIDTMHRPTWKETLLKYTLPVMWILISFIRILINNIKYFHYFSYCEFSTRE